MAPGPVVGFDLDMTLVDSGAGIAATLRVALTDVLGVSPDLTDDQIRPWIGIPLEDTVLGLVPAADLLEQAVADLRQRYEGNDSTEDLRTAFRKYRDVYRSLSD